MYKLIKEITFRLCLSKLLVAIGGEKKMNLLSSCYLHWVLVSGEHHTSCLLKVPFRTNLRCSPSPNTGYGCEVTCLAGPSLGLATLEAALVVEAVAEGHGSLRSGQVQLPFLPAPASESPTLTLTNQQPSASLLLRGHPDVLAAMSVSQFLSAHLLPPLLPLSLSLSL